MKTTSPIAGLFGRSPIRPMQQHIKIVEQCVARIVPLFEALSRGEQDRILELKDEIFDLEQQADDIKNEIRSRLPRGLFMAIDRRDLLEILSAQDSIADTAQDIAGLLVMRKMEIPPPLEPSLMPYLERSHDAVKKCSEIIHELDELLELGFRGRAKDRVLEMIEELSQIEDEGDEIGMERAQRLFEAEDELKPLTVIFWYQLIQEIGDMADYSEKVGDRLRLLIAR